MNFSLDGISENMASFDLLRYLEENEKIGPKNLEYISEALTDIGRNDLVKRIKNFADNYQEKKGIVFLCFLEYLLFFSRAILSPKGFFLEKPYWFVKYFCFSNGYSFFHEGFICLSRLC